MHLVCWTTGPSDYRGIELKVCLRESRDKKIRNKSLIVSSKSESHWLFIVVFCCCFFKTWFLTSWQNFTSWFIQGWLKPLHVIFDGTDDSIFRMLVSSLQLVSCLLLLIYIYMYSECDYVQRHNFFWLKFYSVERILILNFMLR